MEYVHLQVAKLKSTWVEQWYAMANGDAGQYLAIKGMEVSEFFRLMKAHQDELKRKIEAHKKQNK